METEHDQPVFAAQVAIFCIICFGSKDVNWKCLNCDDLVCDGCKPKHDRKHVILKRKRERMICHSECSMCLSFIDVLHYCQFCKLHLCSKCVIRHLSNHQDRDNLIKENSENIRGPYDENRDQLDLSISKRSDHRTENRRRIILFPPYELYIFYILIERTIENNYRQITNLSDSQAILSPSEAIFVEGRLVCPVLHDFTRKDCSWVCLSCAMSFCGTCHKKGFHSMCRTVGIQSVTHTMKWKILDQNRMCRMKFKQTRSRLQQFYDFLHQSGIENSTFRLFYSTDKYEFVAKLQMDIDNITHNLNALKNDENDVDSLCEDGKHYNMYYFGSNVPFLKTYQRLIESLQRLEKCPFEQIKKNMQRVIQSGSLSPLSYFTSFAPLAYSNDADQTTTIWEFAQTRKKYKKKKRKRR